MQSYERQTDQALRREARRARRVSKRQRKQEGKGAATWTAQARELRRAVA